jgi:type I restriction enzyme S subunit
MTLETFFEKFDQFADAPDAVAKLRELVLRLAFSGGLTGKRSTDDGVPDGWESRTIESISASISSGFACSRSHQVENGHVHLRTHNISTLGTLNFDLLVRIDPKMVDPQKASIRAGDILFNNTNSQELVGKTSLVDRDYDYGFSNHITRIRLKDGIFPGFVVFYLTLLRNSGYFARLCTRWINQAAVNTDTLKEQTIPLPPLAEQKRIVAKVDELMALCDRLALQQQERETRHAALARASLARFADAPTPANLPFLFHPSYAIPPADLRKSILTLAVQGKLVPQDPNDEPAEKLFVKLESERRRFAAAHKFRSPVGEPLDDSSAPFAIPPSWKWCRLSSMFNAVADGDHLPPPKSEAGIAFLTIGNITTGTLDFEGCRFVPDSYYRGLADFRRPIRGDILYTIVGATYGRPALVEGDRPFCVQRHIAILKPPQSVDVGFLMAVLRSPLAYDQASASTTGTAQPTIPLGSLRNFAAPLPPLAEQRRIVAKVDQLMALVDALEQQLAASHATAANLLSALVAELTAASRGHSTADARSHRQARGAVSARRGHGVGERCSVF